MRVLFWCELFRPHIGGVELWSVDLIHALQALGYEFLVIAAHGPTRLPDETEFAGIAVHRFSFHDALLKRDFNRIKHIADEVVALKQRFEPNLSHINTSQPSLFFYDKTRSAYPCPTLFTVHEPPLLSAGANSLLARVLKTADKVVATSSAMRDDVLKLAPAAGKKCCVVHSAIRQTAADTPAIEFVPPQLLCIGRLSVEKGLDLALDAFARIRPRHPDARLIIAGDGTERDELERRAADLAITSHVDFLGWVDPDAVPTLLERATVVIVPSRCREAFGLVALQAGEYARPVIAFDVGGLAEIIVHGQTGILVPAEDTTAMADAIHRLLIDPNTAIKLGAAAQRQVRDRFDYQRFVSRYQALYQEVAGIGDRQSCDKFPLT